MARLPPDRDLPSIPDQNGVGSRSTTSGIATIAVLVSLVLLAALTLTLQARTTGDGRILARLTKDLEVAAARDSILDELRVPLVKAMTGDPDTGLTFDGSAMVVPHGGREWEVRLQDVEGLVDLYLGPQEQFDLLSVDASAIIAAREKVRSDLPPASRFPVLPMSAAQFGFDASQVEGLITQSGSTGMLRLRSLPEPLREAGVLPGPRENEQITRIAVRIRPLSTTKAP